MSVERMVYEFHKKHNHLVTEVPTEPWRTADISALSKMANVLYDQFLAVHEKYVTVAQGLDVSYTFQDAKGNRYVSSSVQALRARLMMEELSEVMQAMAVGNLPLLADGLADLVYVVVGTAIAFGIPFDEVFSEVHRSNMTKAKLDASSKGGKIAKEGFTPPDIMSILRQHGYR